MTFGISLALLIYLLPILNFIVFESDSYEPEDKDVSPIWGYVDVIGWPLIMGFDLIMAAWYSETVQKFFGKKDAE